MYLRFRVSLQGSAKREGLRAGPHLAAVLGTPPPRTSETPVISGMAPNLEIGKKHILEIYIRSCLPYRAYLEFPGGEPRAPACSPHLPPPPDRRATTRRPPAFAQPGTSAPRPRPTALAGGGLSLRWASLAASRIEAAQYASGSSAVPRAAILRGRPPAEAAFQSVLRLVDACWRWAGRPAESAGCVLGGSITCSALTGRAARCGRSAIAAERYFCEATGRWPAQVESSVRAGLFSRAWAIAPARDGLGGQAPARGSHARR